MSQSLAALADSIRNAIPNLKSDQPQTVDAFFARRLIDKNEAVKIDPDDLATTLANLLASTGAAAAIIAALVGTAGGSLRKTATLAATSTLTAAQSGTTFFLAHATEFATTLPAPAVGLNFRFIVGLAPSGASYTILSKDGTNNIHGIVVSATDAGGSVDSTAGTAADTITFVDGQALKGDVIDMESDGTSWYVRGFVADEDALTFTQT